MDEEINQTKPNYFIAVNFKNTGVSSLRKAVAPKHVGANSKIYNI
jgi:hypothetical protein